MNEKKAVFLPHIKGSPILFQNDLYHDVDKKELVEKINEVMDELEKLRKENRLLNDEIMKISP